MISEKNYQTLGLNDAKDVTSTIGGNCHVGSIQSQDTALLICGRVNGDVSCTGAVIVAEGAQIMGGITAKSALVAGSVVSPSPDKPSTIKIEGTFILQSTARVMCHVEAGALETAIGAVVEGMLSLNRGMRTLDANTHQNASDMPAAPTMQAVTTALPTITESDTSAATIEAVSQAQSVAQTDGQNSINADQFMQDMEQINGVVVKGKELAESGDFQNLNVLIAELKSVDLAQFEQFRDQAKTTIDEAIQTLEALGENINAQAKTQLPSAFFVNDGVGFNPAGQ